MPTTSCSSAETPISRRGDSARALVALVVMGLGACVAFEKALRKETPGPIYSPNGEPLSGGALGDPKCDGAMRRWFARVDTDHDGTIELGEFLADARRQFAAMDLEHTGVLTPAVLAQYRAPYLAGRESQAKRDEIEEQDEEERERARRRHNGESEPPIGLDRADPVMLADVNLRNRVTLDDFLAYARRNFAILDKDKNGRLDSGELAATCKP
jgi:hypothetical protein